MLQDSQDKKELIRELEELRFDRYLLQERIKELNCHQEVTRILSDAGPDIMEAAEKIAKVILDAFQIPEATGARITINERTVNSERWNPDGLLLTEPIIINNVRIGSLQVSVSSDQGLSGREPFLKEEGTLLYIISERFRKFIELKEKEAALQKSESLYQSILQSSPDVLTITDLEGKILFSSRRALKMFGYEADYNFIGQNLIEFVDPRDHEKALAGIQDMFSQKIAGATEYRAVRKDGSVFEIEVNGDFIFDHHGNPVNMIFVTRDVTKRRETEDLLARTEERFKRLVDNINDVIYEVDTRGTIVYVSPSIQRIVGFTAEELTGQNFFTYMYPDDRPQLMQALTNLGTTDFSWLEYRYLTRDGDIRWVRSSTKAIIRDGQLVGGIGSLTDITQRKNVEDEIKSLNETLELKIEERTRELEQSKEILENFFSVALDLLCIADTTGHFIRVNKAWEGILGYTTEDLEGRLFLDFVHPFDVQSTLDAMSQLSEQNPILNFTNRYKTKSGDYRYIEWRSVPIGQTIYAAARDITERRLTEEFEQEILQLSIQMTGLQVSEIPAALDMSLARIGDYLSADRSYIFEFTPDFETMNNSHEWCATDVRPVIDEMQNVSTQVFPHWMEELKSKEVIHIKRVDDLPDSWSAEREILQSQDIKSIIVLPITSENQLIGFVGLDSVKSYRTYSKEEIQILSFWSRMLASLINNYRSGMLLEQTQQNYLTFFNSIDDFLFILNLEGNIVEVNRTVRNRLGFDDDELSGQSITAVHPPDRVEEVKSVLTGLLAGCLDHCEIPLMTKEGGVVPVETRVTRGKWNGVESFFGVSKDISQIQLSEQKFSSAFLNNSSMMAISLFEEGDYLDVNNAFLDTLGYTREEVIGKSNKSLSMFPDPGLRQKILDQLNSGQPVRKMDILMRRKDGVVRNGLLSADILYVGDQKCMISTTIDVTDLKEAEKKLQEARLEAEEANAAKSEFLSRMSHELRTPMNSILGFAQLLEMGDLAPAQKKAVHHIYHSGKHLLDLINEVLDLTRIEAGRLSLSLEPVHIDDIITQSCEILKPLAQQNNINLIVSDSPDMHSCLKVDSQRLKQVLINLLNNAVKYNKPGGIVQIKCLRLGVPGDEAERLRISITDTGSGISTENIPKLFVPFERIGADKTDKEGTGLGLAVTRKLVQLMHGSIGVSSEWGQGSTFWVEFPICDCQPDLASEIKGAQVSGMALNGKKGMVVYVEDNQPNIDLVRQIVDTYCPEVNLVTYLTGSGAAEFIATKKPDLVLLDVNLPDKNGDEVLAELQENQNTRSIPVVVISADAMPKQVERLLQAGARKYVTKPLDVTELIKVFKEYVK